MRLKNLELNSFKSFAGKTALVFQSPIVCVVGPNGSGKSNVVEAIRFVLGEQSIKSMRGKTGADLIFKGSKNLPKASRAAVSIYFDNRDKIFKLENEGGENINLNFDTISITREVFPDGINRYSLNGSEVRLKDINNLLASVRIGSSGHHIISQGEADRILNASAKERKMMLEDALGLKIYHYKIKESERKLERTESNMKEVGMLRRENAPHLNFLKKQVEKFEKAKEIENELAALYREYLKKESLYLESEQMKLSGEREKTAGELEGVRRKILEFEEKDDSISNHDLSELRNVENQLNEIRAQKGALERKLGRTEGMLESKENKLKISGRCPLCGSEIKQLEREQEEKRQNEVKEFTELQISRQEILEQIKKLEKSESDLAGGAETLRIKINRKMESLRDVEREKFSSKVREQELSSTLELIKLKEENLKRETEAFDNEVKEGVALIGEHILLYRSFVFDGKVERNIQEEQRRKIERLKIKLEDAGLGSGAELMKEFREVTERDQFLARELEDLQKSIESLNALISDLKAKIDLEFKEGIQKINTEFQGFFTILFGGGSAKLSIVAENKPLRHRVLEEGDPKEFSYSEDDGKLIFEQGIEISVSLPHKKVKELHAFSGGERSLTSIALLFAMSQVNPPPFLVLDETDAALDEANSRKYGDMLERLSKHSELIVVTHNRETMSRAGVLYGVTVGADGASKLLSVKFDEATQIAK